VNGDTGHYHQENFLQLLAKGGILSALKHDPDVPDGDVTQHRSSCCSAARKRLRAAFTSN
jgi:hypothetical protein